MELKTLSELAKAHGHTQPAPVSEDRPFTADHLVAEARHGWLRAEHLSGEEVRLTDEDYLAAIEAAKLGTVHGPANMRGVK